jgi:hypothetical protein
MFTVGTRVKVIDEKQCAAVCVEVAKLGMKGTCLKNEHTSSNRKPYVFTALDGSSQGWFLPTTALKRLHVKKVEV